MNSLCVLSPHSPAVHSPPAYSAWKRTPPMENPVFYSGGHTLRFPEGCQGFPLYQAMVSSFDFRPPLSGAAPAGIFSPLKALTATSKEGQTEDKNTVFVAGATGRVGSRAVRELLKLGFRVRAAVRSTQSAEALVDSVKRMRLDGVAENPEIQPIQNLEIVTCDLENQGSIGPAIGVSSVVLCSIGASEKEFLDVTGPYRIDYRATKNLIDAATAAKVKHFILVTSLGTHKIGFPASLLNLFWGVLIWKRKAEEHLIASGIPYTIVRPGGMERPTDSFKETHNLVLANEDTYSGGLVSNLQVAELIAVIVRNTKLSVYKVIEVIAETTAPHKPIKELLSKIRAQKEIPDENGAGSKPSIQSEPTLFGDETFSRKKTPKTRPLSPYSMYDDFKPPASPTPTPSVTRFSSMATGRIKAEQKLESIISPVPGHEKTETETAQTSSNHLTVISLYSLDYLMIII
ncbi:hypothetical protein KSP39_PZI020177 [Platanthera zijinensis]|uniref:NAD(P)-binding domain-containing protein n=1 Tax=Platanthera zijinensis TaxID=2320716 RepID=A0AAP0B0Q7_9ASPA